jgi:hypothetical protein
MRRGIGRLRAGGGGFSPAQIAFTSGLWLDPSDITTGFQDSAGTTPQTATGQPTGKRLDKSGRGNHVLQATTTSRPIYNVTGAISTDTMDAVDDGYSTATFIVGTLVADMDYFVAIKRAAATNVVAGLSNGPAGGSFFGAAEASAIASSAVVGTPTNWVDGVAMVDQNRNTLNTALTVSAWHILEVRNLNLASWTQATLGSYTSFMLSGDVGGVILCPAQSTANRNSIRTWLGAKVGLTL